MDFAQPRMNYIPGGKAYIDNNLDRFGVPIRPMKAIDLNPGPGDYQIKGLADGGENGQIKAQPFA